MRRWSSIVGLVFVVIGVFALLQVALTALGIAFKIWWIFWPFVLIGIGVWIILGVSRPTRSAVREQASVPLDGASEASIRVRHGAGRLTIGPGSSGGTLASGVFGGGLDASTSREGSRLSVDMRVKYRNVSDYIIPWSRGGFGLLDWDFTINPDVPVALALETGASESRLNLTDLQVRDLRVSTGASSTVVELPARAGAVKVSIECGAAAVRLLVPGGVAAWVRVRHALAGIHVDTTRFPRSGDEYRSPDYERAANKVEIFVETGVGSVDIR
jgi:hypothetical protein